MVTVDPEPSEPDTDSLLSPMELSPLTDKLDMDNVLWLDLQQKILSIVLFGLNYRYRNIQNVQTNVSNDMG